MGEETRPQRPSVPFGETGLNTCAGTAGWSSIRESHETKKAKLTFLKAGLLRASAGPNWTKHSCKAPNRDGRARGRQAGETGVVPALSED